MNEHEHLSFIRVYGALALALLFAYGAWRGAEVGALLAVAAAAATYVFQFVVYLHDNDPDVEGWLMPSRGLAVIAVVLFLAVWGLFLTSLTLSTIGV